MIIQMKKNANGCELYKYKLLDKIGTVLKIVFDETLDDACRSLIGEFEIKTCYHGFAVIVDSKNKSEYGVTWQSIKSENEAELLNESHEILKEMTERYSRLETMYFKLANMDTEPASNGTIQDAKEVIKLVAAIREGSAK